MSEKPLHVRVAEALGWVWERPCGLLPDTCYGKYRLGDEIKCIDNYDTDWSATGPLIEKHMIELLEAGGAWFARAKTAPNYTDTKWFQNPLLAVCHLILALKEAGKL